MNVERLVDAVTWIPHLDLGLQFDTERLRQEFLTVSPELLQPYRSSAPHVGEKIARAWNGVSLFSPDGSLHSDLTENPSPQGMLCQPTPLAEKLPYACEVVDTLGGQDRIKNTGTRARFMRVSPKSSLTWHSHQLDGVESFRPNIIVVHVPLWTPERFRYSVIPLAEFRLKDHESGPMKIYTENYPVGRATMFNSVHYHNVFNDDEIRYRLSLMLYLDLNNERTFKIVDKAVSEYSGPFIART